VLRKQVSESFVREFLKIHHTIARKQIDRLPCLIIELHALAGYLYQRAPSDTPSLKAC
jgi:hypothetical protein